MSPWLNGYLPALALAPIAQRIERKPPKLEIEVQFLLGVEAMAGGERRPPKSRLYRDSSPRGDAMGICMVTLLLQRAVSL